MMNALRFCPNDETKLQLINLEDGKEDTAEFVIKNPDEVVVQVFNAGLCGTDIHIVQVKTRSRGNKDSGHCNFNANR